MFDFNKPKIEITELSEDKKFGRFVVEPLERGYKKGRTGVLSSRNCFAILVDLTLHYEHFYIP